jgi:hypothetical protein
MATAIRRGVPAPSSRPIRIIGCVLILSAGLLSPPVRSALSGKAPVVAQQVQPQNGDLIAFQPNQMLRAEVGFAGLPPYHLRKSGRVHAR